MSTTLSIEAHPRGAILPVKAQPGARSVGLRGVVGGALRVAVTQVPEKGKANQALIAALCSALDLRKSQVELLGGETSRSKRFLIQGLSVEQLRRRVLAALPPDEASAD